MPAREFAEKNPDAVRAFLAGWFDTIAYMHAHRDRDDRDRAPHRRRVAGACATRDYDELIGMFNRTGRFDPKALAVLSRSFVEMGMLPQEPDMRTLVTEQFLPAAK